MGLSFFSETEKLDTYNKETKYNIAHCIKDNGRNSKPTPKVAEVRFQLSAGFFIKLWQHLEKFTLHFGQIHM